MNYNNITNFNILRFNHNNLCKDYVNYNNITNFGVLKSDHNINYNNIVNFNMLRFNYLQRLHELLLYCKF